jgi:hypothetical protein
LGNAARRTREPIDLVLEDLEARTWFLRVYEEDTGVADPGLSSRGRWSLILLTVGEQRLIYEERHPLVPWATTTTRAQDEVEARLGRGAGRVAAELVAKPATLMKLYWVVDHGLELMPGPWPGLALEACGTCSPKRMLGDDVGQVGRVEARWGWDRTAASFRGTRRKPALR